MSLGSDLIMAMKEAIENQKKEAIREVCKELSFRYGMHPTYLDVFFNESPDGGLEVRTRQYIYKMEKISPLQFMSASTEELVSMICKIAEKHMLT